MMEAGNIFTLEDCMMKNNTTAKRAVLELSLQWQSHYGLHNDRWYAEKIDFWRDFFPGNLRKNIAALTPGDVYREAFDAGSLVPEYTEKKIIEFPKNLFVNGHDSTLSRPLPGRFYPQSYAWKALNSFPETTTPFRLIAASANTLVADTNHPLAKTALTVEATMIQSMDTASQRGGAANDIAELLTINGPGMQVPDARCAIHPYMPYPLSRESEEEDSTFYRLPRLVHHLDSTARAHVRALYGRLLAPRSKILDLMSSWQSHLPDTLRDCHVTGIGLNREELESNKQLSFSLVHDLNMQPLLPFNDHHFDAVICTVSIEYLVRPREVMAEVARILRPGGIFVVIASDRWFPGKQIEPWADLHPFERQGLVLNYFLHENGFKQLRTESLRGYPRPAEDRHSHRLYLSDPLFVVSGIRRN